MSPVEICGGLCGPPVQGEPSRGAGSCKRQPSFQGGAPRTGGARGLLGEAFPPLPLTLYFPTARLTGGSGAIGSFPSSGRTAPPAPLFWGSAVPEHAHASSAAYDFISSLFGFLIVCELRSRTAQGVRHHAAQAGSWVRAGPRHWQEALLDPASHTVRKTASHTQK